MVVLVKSSTPELDRFLEFNSLGNKAVVVYTLTFIMINRIQGVN